MRTFLKITEHLVLVTLIIFALLNYFFPLLYPQNGDVAEFGIPLVFYRAYLAPLPAMMSSEQVSIFNGAAIVVDIIFAYLVGCFAVFVEKKFKEKESPLFRWVLRVAIFLAAVLFIARIFVRGF